MTELPPAVRVLIEIELGVVALGIAIGIVGFVVILLRTVFNRSALVSPRAFKKERIEAEADEHKFEPDCAWPWYFRRQVSADERRIQAERKAVDARLWGWLGEPLFAKSPTTGVRQLSPLWLLLPYPLVVLPFLLAVFTAALACNVVFLLAEWVVLGVSWLGFLVVVGVLRGGEATWLRFRHTSASCPKCFFVSDRPAYRCAKCAALHRDIRPGRLGVFQRRCECGEVMPTMVLRAAWSEEAVCQRCGERLREGAAALRDVRAPIFGDVSAGKTRLLYASLDRITALAKEHGLAISYPDPESRQLADTALATIRASRDTAKSDVTLPHALSFRLGTGSNSTLVHLYDAAGELYRDSERYEDLSFLDNGHGLIFVVDPFALAAVRDTVAGQASVAQHVASGEGKDPDLAYTQVVSQLRDGGVKAKSQRLAIVVSKADALGDCGIDPPTASTEIAGWLYENGLHNVVLAAPNEFAEVRYFLVASVPAEKAARETDPGAPLRWLLRTQGVPLPAEPEAVAVSEAGDE